MTLQGMVPAGVCQLQLNMQIDTAMAQSLEAGQWLAKLLAVAQVAQGFFQAAGGSASQPGAQSDAASVQGGANSGAGLVTAAKHGFP